MLNASSSLSADRIDGEAEASRHYINSRRAFAISAIVYFRAATFSIFFAITAFRHKIAYGISLFIYFRHAFAISRIIALIE